MTNNPGWLTKAHMMPSGRYANITNDSIIKRDPGQLSGFYVNSTSSGVIQLYDGTSTSGTAITGQITPAIGWHPLPVAFATALYIEKVSGTIDLTAVYV